MYSSTYSQPQYWFEKSGKPYALVIFTPGFPLNRRMSGPQRQSGCFGEEQ